MGDVEQNFSSMSDDRREYVAAVAALTRLDEAQKHVSLSGKTYVPSALRREAIAAASLEGALVRQEALCRLLGDRYATNAGRAARLTADIHDAMKMVMEWPTSAPDAALIIQTFFASDASSGRLMRPDVTWSLEDDATWMAEELSLLAETAEPWTAGETLRRIWVSGRFFGTSRRMAAIAAIWAVPKGFGCSLPAFGLTAQFATESETLRNSSHDKDSWSTLFASSIAAGCSEELVKLSDSLAARASLLALCPPGRSSSSIEAAIDFLFTNPVFTAKQLSDSLGLTSRGAKVVLDKLLESNVVEAENVSRNRKYICRRVM